MGDLAFISYSHNPDRKWVDRLLILLKPFLKSGRLEVWADPYIETGSDWRREIEGKLAQARMGVLLVSPEFAASDFITDVEVPAVLAAAKSRGLIVFCVPIRAMVPGVTEMLGLSGYQWPRPEDQPLELLPVAKRNAALVTIVKDLVQRFGKPAATTVVQAPVVAAPVESLAPRPGGDLGLLHGVPELPPHFAPRQETLDVLKRAILHQPQQRFGISAAARTGIHGRGGLGKTVLATALAHDPEIRRAFPDGVYWVTLGQQPSLLALQTALAREVGGTDLVIESVPQGTSRLGELLAERSCLLVLDDVWEVLHATAFTVVGPRGRVLVTTRDRHVLTGLGSETHELDALDPGSALHLLAGWAGRALPLPAEAELVAKECGHLPLALALAGAQVRKGVAWNDVLAALERGNLQFLDHPHGSVFKSMYASIDALDDDDAARYRELTIFPEDVAVPESVIAKLWRPAGLDALATTRLLLALEGRGLLRCTGEPGARTVTCHDLQGDFLRLIAEDLPGIHARLLDSYAETLPGAAGVSDAVRWASLPRGESYLWEWLGHHLLGANRGGDFNTLATNVLWLSAKIAATGVAALLADLTMLVNRAPTVENHAVEKAIRLESGWLYRDPNALAGQLYNRLVCEGMKPEQIHETVTDLHPPVRLAHPVGIGGGELRGFFGHSDEVTACAYSPDGTRILSASRDRTLREWDRLSGQELRRFEGHSNSVTACAYSSDGARILSASDDDTLREWDRLSGQELRRFEGHLRSVKACAYSSDGARILSASKDSTLREWDRLSGQEVRRFEGHSNSVTACAYSPDGACILTASWDNTLREWDRLSGQEVRRFEGHSYSVTACAYSLDGTCILSASWDGTLREWNRLSGEELHCFEGHSSCVSACAYSSDGARILSASWDGTVREWSRQSGEELRRFEGHSRIVTACAYSPDGARILSTSRDKTLREWDRLSGEELRHIERHSGEVAACAYSPDGTRILSASSDKTLREWDRLSGEELRCFEGHSGEVVACAYSPDGTRILSASRDKTLREWDRLSGEELRCFEGHSGYVVACAYSADGTRILSASWDSTLREWNRSFGEELRRFEGHSSYVVACAYSADGTRILSASWDGTLREWNRRSGEELLRFEEHSNAVNACAYSADGTRILSASDDGTLREWDRQSGEELRRFEGHSNLVRACAYSPDGTRILSASFDGTVRIWDRQQRRLLHTLYCSVKFQAIAVSKRSVTVGDDAGNVWILDCDFC